jgi:hypothetical protein
VAQARPQTVQIRTVVERVHLVHAHAGEPIGVRLDRVEEPDRLAVGHRHDQVRAVADVIDHGGGRKRSWPHR